MDEKHPADWLRQARDRFHEVTKDLTDEQVIAYIRARAATADKQASPVPSSSRPAA